MTPGRLSRAPGRSRQAGATLVVALIMLVLITLVLVSGFSLSTSNLKSVGNMQVREESVAAANRALEMVVGSPFTDDPQAQDIDVDINSDGVTDYTVAVSQPLCVRAIQASADEPSDPDIPVVGGSASWYTDWDIAATANDATSGASVVVRQGVRVLLDQAKRDEVCS